MQLSNEISHAVSLISFVLLQKPKWMDPYSITFAEYTLKNIKIC